MNKLIQNIRSASVVGTSVVLLAPYAQADSSVTVKGNASVNENGACASATATVTSSTGSISSSKEVCDPKANYSQASAKVKDYFPGNLPSSTSKPTNSSYKNINLEISNQHFVDIDNIKNFSNDTNTVKSGVSTTNTAAIPEPTTIAGTLLALGALGARRRKKIFNKEERK
ncbi:MAG: PEP-CTERM sorting domain-containing protein [Moorea sp. SIO2B7]|nr:PEP-CTERM sorting domain-containing protein [Moorena sp. SIO2B7]